MAKTLNPYEPKTALYDAWKAGYQSFSQNIPRNRETNLPIALETAWQEGWDAAQSDFRS